MAAQSIPLNVYACKLIRRDEVAEGTMAFRFEKPPGYAFTPGQAADITLPNPPETDGEGNTRTFSIASPPFDDNLTFTTRMRDTAFKRSLKKMAPGAVVNISPPMGSFTLHKNPGKPAVFLAGGIGITPFLSIVSQADHDQSPHKLYLFYANRRPEDTAFLDLLDGLEKTNRNFRLIATMSQLSQSKQKWSGERGWIDKAMLARHLHGLIGPIYYVAGPPAMVAAMRQMLTVSGISEDDVRSEDFAGY